MVEPLFLQCVIAIERVFLNSVTNCLARSFIGCFGRLNARLKGPRKPLGRSSPTLVVDSRSGH